MEKVNVLHTLAQVKFDQKTRASVKFCTQGRREKTELTERNEAVLPRNKININRAWVFSDLQFGLGKHGRLDGSSWTEKV